MKKLFNRKGFSLAELMVVVAIVIALAAVGFVSLTAHMRNLHQLEMDGQAKEIFVAAQNHLAMAESQGYLGLLEPENDTDVNPFGSAETKVIDEAAGTTKKTGVYYFVIGADKGELSTSVLSQMLPQASVNEEARIGGSYIIRYQKDPAVILDVFYVDPSSNRYGHTFSAGEYAEVMKLVDTETENNKGKRRSYDFEGDGGDKGVVLGYYGGVAAMELEKGDELKPPVIKVLNGDTLKVEVTNTNVGKNTDTNALVLVLRSGGVQLTVPIYDNTGAFVGGTGRISTRTTNGTNATVTVTLDDLTNSGDYSIASLFGRSSGFKPGDNLEIKAITYNNTLITNVAESSTVTTNSLFASLTSGVAEITSFRHLLNLDKNTSGLNVTVTGAKQTSDLDWAQFMNETGADPYTNSVSLYRNNASNVYTKMTSSGKYLPADVDYALAYDGDGHQISNVDVSSADNAANAGLFGQFGSDSGSGSIQNLELIDFNISGTGTAGALVGSAKNTTISAVLVHNTENNTDLTITSSGTAAGGLAGSLDNAPVEYCAAAVYVRNTTGAAGGLVGEAKAGSTISYSYSGGFTYGAKYQKKGEDNYSSAPVNVISGVVSASAATPASTAGGLVGKTAANITNSYSTCSVYGATAGGLAGEATGSAAFAKCYSVGKVMGSGTLNHFVGTGGAVTTGNGNKCYYLTGVSDAEDVSGDQTMTNLFAVAAGDSRPEYASFILPEENRQKAKAYDKTLMVKFAGMYYFPTVAQLAGSGFDDLVAAHCGDSSSLVDWMKSFTTEHYGDWQVPGLVKLNYQLLNGDKLDLKLELKSNTSLVTMTVTGLTSGVTRAFQFEVTDAHRLTLKQEGIVSGSSILWSKSAPAADYVTMLGSRVHDVTSKSVEDPVTHVSETRYDVQFSLDDITMFGGQFVRMFANENVTFDASLSPTPEQKLIPGENITVRLGGGNCSWAELQTLDSVPDAQLENPGTDYNCKPKTDNSLFAKNTDTAVMSTANLLLLRHLQNLDTSVSGVNPANTSGQVVTTASLENTIDWDSSIYEHIYLKDATSADATGTSTKRLDGSFNGIYNPLLTSFSGNSHLLRYMVIKAGKGEENTGVGNAGLFRLVSGDFTLSNLWLLRPSVTAASNKHAGAAIAEVSGGTVALSSVQVDAGSAASGSFTIATSGNGNAGGIIGYTHDRAANATAGITALNATVTVNNSTVNAGTGAGSALTVTNGSGNAGGIIGRASGTVTLTGVTVHTGSGGNGRVTVTSTTGNAGGVAGYAGSTVILDNVRVYVASAGGTITVSTTDTTDTTGNRNAGGLVGSIAGSGSVTLRNGSGINTGTVGGTVTVSAATTGNAGGLIGSAAGSGTVTVNNITATVVPNTSSTPGSFTVTAGSTAGGGSAGGLVGYVGGTVTVNLNTTKLVSTLDKKNGNASNNFFSDKITGSVAIKAQGTGGGSAGGLVGNVAGGTVNMNSGNAIGANIVVVSVTGDAGGLVGVSAGTLNVDNSLTNAYVTASGSGAAGGLIGKVSSGTATLKSSYVGGHTSGGVYYVKKETTPTHTEESASGARWNVISGSGAAGGLIGEITGTLAAEKTFTTASVYSSGAGKAGGIFGVMNGTLSAIGSKTLDLVYTVAPVYSVKATVDGVSNGGTNGGAIGTTTAVTVNGDVFYLPVVYKDPKPENDGGNIAAVASNPASTFVKIASYFESAISGHSSTNGTADLEQYTTYFDNSLVTTYKENGQEKTSPAEYPFAVWTTVDGTRYFYGDWEPMDEKESQGFDIHYRVVADPNTQQLGDLKDYYTHFGTGNPIPEFDTVYIQLSPFDQTKSQVTLPTMPYRFGYNYGNRKANTSPQETLAVESAAFQETTTLYAWAVYVGDQSSAANVSALDSNTLMGYYTSTGGSVNLPQELLEAAMDKLKETNSNPGPDDHAQITLVAYYYKLDNQYAVQFKDYDPAAAANPSESDYDDYGSVVVVSKQGSQEHLYYKDVCGVGGNLSAPYRSVKGYRFMGWYTKPGGPDVTGNVQVFANANGSMTLMLTGSTPDTPAEIKDNVTLYSWYAPDDMATMTLSFVLQKDGVNYPLNMTYPVRYNKVEGISAVIELPGYEDGVKVTEVKDGTGTALPSGPSGYYELVEAEGSTATNTLHESISFHTGKLDTYPASCAVYFEGNVNMVGVVVVHQLDHTKKTDGGGYAYDTGSIYVEYKHTLILDSDKPIITEDYFPAYALGTLGVYEAPSQADVHYYRYTEGAYGITGTELSTGETIRWVVVVPYTRTSHFLRFTNLGQSRSDPAFGWKKLYVGEALANYLPDTPTGGYFPRLYGDSATFREWDYWNKTEYEKPADDPTRHKLSEAPAAMPDYDLVLEAQYDGQPVDYTLLIWVENADDDGYTQLGSQVIHDGAYAGEEITVRQVSLTEARSQFSNYPDDRVLPIASKTERITNSPYVDLRGILDKTMTVNNKQITVDLTPYITYSDYQRGVKANGQGTATVNVYFKRKVYRLRFDVGYGVPDPNSTTITYDPIGADENYSGTVYGLVNGSYVPLTGDGTNWYTPGTEGGTGSKPYALVNGKYEELTPTPVEGPQRYEPEYEYILHTAEDGESPQFGVYGEKYEELGITTIPGTSVPDKTVYVLTSTLTTGEKYLLVSINSAGTGYALSYNGNKGSNPVRDQVTVNAAENGITGNWIDPNEVEARSVWTIQQGSNNGQFRFYNGSYNIQRYGSSNGGLYFDTDNYTTNNWYWDGSNNYLKNSTSYYYLYYSNSSNNFTISYNDAHSIYLYKQTTITGSTTPATYTYAYNSNPHNGARYTVRAYSGQPLLAADVSDHFNDGSLWYYDGNAYVPVKALPVETETVYMYNGTAYTEVQWLNPYTDTRYKENRTQGYSSYYIGNSTNSDNYRNFTANDNYNCRKRFTDEGKRITGLSAGESPFTRTTETVYSPGYYHGTYRYGNYDIFYWDVVAKYGANIYDMWPNELTEQRCRDGYTDRTYRFIGFLANLYSNFCTTKGSSSSIKGKVDCMTDLVIKTRYTNNGSYTARAVTVNPDGSYGDEVAHELFCRYSSGYNNSSYQIYLYRYEIKDPNKNSNENDGYTVKYETVVRSEYGHPYRQNAGDLSGYVLVETRLVKPNGQAIDSSNLKSNSDYTDNVQDIELQLPPGGTVRGVLMRFRYEPISYNLNFGYAGDLTGTISGFGTVSVPFTKYFSKVQLGTGSSSKYIYEYDNATLPNPNSAEYYFTGNWYDNAACSGEPVLKAGDANYNKTLAMPASDLTLYAEMKHKKVSVTLNLGEDDVDEEDKTVTLNGEAENYSGSRTWQDPLKNMLRNEADDDYSIDFTPEKSAPEDADYYWVFDGWSEKENGTKEDEYIYNQPQMGDVVLYPIWTRVDNPKPGSVVVVYKYYDEDEGDYVRFYPTSASMVPLTTHPGTTTPIMIGDPFTMLAPEVSGYTPVDPSVGPVVVTGENFEVTFRYRQTSWTYTVNYYIEIDPLTIGSDSWLYGEGTFQTGQIKALIATVTGNSDFQYHLFNYLEPDNCPAWVDDMAFVRYEYNGKTSSNSYISIHPDDTNNTAVVDVYLRPDTDSINIPDIVTFYSGKNFKDYSQADPVVVPSTIGTLAARTETRFVYYDSTGEKKRPEDVVHAGAYGVRAYITLTLGTGDSAKTYVIWKSAGSKTDPVPLHLYIQRRTVILYSASSTITYTNGDALAIANSQSDVYCRPGTGTAQEIAIQELYNELKLVDYKAAANDQPEVIGNAGFVGSDGLIYEFSSSSFRRNPGTSLNLFTYKKKGETQLSDYYFYVMFGELTVNG